MQLNIFQQLKQLNNHTDSNRCDYCFLQTAGLSGWVNKKFTELKLDLLTQTDSLLESSSLIKNSRSTTAGVLADFGMELFVKRHNRKGYFQQLRRSFKLPRSYRNLYIALMLKDLQVPTPEVYAALTCRCKYLWQADYLFLQSMAQPMTLADNLSAVTKAEGALERLVEKLTILVSKIHEHGLYHGDLKLSNILFCPEDGDFKLGLFDFDGSCVYTKELSNYWREKELSRVISSMLLNILGLDADDFAESLVTKYEHLTRRTLNHKAIFKRVKYLKERVRKK